MSRKIRFYEKFAAGITFLLLSAALFAAEVTTKELAPTPTMSHISKLTSMLLTNKHYTQRQLSEEVSVLLFEDYFKALDPTKMFFTQQDIAQFESEKKELGKKLKNGDVQFAFDVFKLFLKRLDEYENFTRTYLKTNPSLNTDETFEFNRTKLPWVKTDAELESLWKKKIRNDLILIELMDRSKKELRKNFPADKKVEQKQAKTARKEKPVKVNVPRQKTPQERTLQRISQFLQYYRNMEAIEVLELYISALTKIYDPHSEYMSPRTQEDFDINMRLSLVGIGAVLTSEDGYTKVVKLVPGGPADLDGRLKTEDRIIAVTQEDGEPVDTLDMPLTKVVDQIRGKENTKVTLTILEGSKGTSAVPVNITLTRAKVRLQESEASGKVHELQTKNGVRRIAVLTLPSFYIDFNAAYHGDANYKSSTRDMKALIQKLSKEKPLDAVIIDLRSNGGGSLLEAVNLTGLFIKEGPVVQVTSGQKCTVDEDQDGGLVTYSGPLAVLTNRFSASAAEIFAGAIKDYQRGIILGDSKTHGKGTVQTLLDLQPYADIFNARKPLGSLKLTSGKFYRINGDSTQLKGIVPDIIFPSFSDAMEIGEENIPHAMKWDTVKPVKYQIADPTLPSLIPVLRNKSMKRLAASREFTKLKKDIDTFSKIRNRKTIVLNLEQRWKEYLAEKKLQEEQDKLLKLDTEDSKKNTIKDLYLEETINVVRDMIDMARTNQ